MFVEGKLPAHVHATSISPAPKQHGGQPSAKDPAVRALKGAWLRIPRRPVVARRLAERCRAVPGTPLWSSIHGMAGNGGTEEQGLRSQKLAATGSG